MYLLYQLALAGLFLSILPAALWASYKTGKYRRSFSQRLGKLSEELRAKLNRGQWIWVHAVSMGETAAVAPLIEAIKQRYPQYQILLTTVTETGQEMAHKNLPQIDAHLFFPLDFDSALNRIFAQVSPKLVILAETEIWPNFLHHLKKRNIPVLLVNGRISQKSFQHYKLAKFFMRRVLGDIRHFSMQTKEDAERIIQIGAAPEAVSISGNLKFDQRQSLLSAGERKNLRDRLKIPPAALVWVVGSTHPGEEEIILPSFKELKQKHSDLIMILVPRHPERWKPVEDLLTKAGIGFVRKTNLVKEAGLQPVVLLDTIGELAAIYSLASVVFMGGTLVPIGGHNILEAALYSKAIVFGPYMNNFAEIARLFTEKNAALQVKNVQELNQVMDELLADAHLRSRLGQAAVKVIEENQGATERSLASIGKYLSQNTEVRSQKSE
ncbi:MAG: 3-deoxy-D-manno-octulosonic acid transferase [Candidatus Schekmanbacteria bacterium]|nr:3-deoxy-D-manno-octulosonic acid transferase [Candidatus Schekmanbacteria bacterium]